MSAEKEKIAQRRARPFREKTRGKVCLPVAVLPLAYFLVEAFAFAFLDTGEAGTFHHWPLVFGLVWGILLTGLIRLLPSLAGRIVFGLTYFLGAIYAAVETGYFFVFREMMWLMDFRYASEGSDYFDVLLTYPVGWFLGFALLLALGGVILWKWPRWRVTKASAGICAGVLAAGILGAVLLPQAVFLADSQIRYSGSDYGRAQSAQAAYDNMFNAHRLYEVCGLYQTAVKDAWANFIYPITPGYMAHQQAAHQEIDDYFAQRPDQEDNDMTGIFAGKNVILVLMESMDDWAIGEHTPTICRLMDEGINFENFYTPGYGSVRTFNSEFTANTGNFLSSAGGFAFDYVTNGFDQSLANQLKAQGYSAMTFHYNDPAFYSRGVFEPAMGYDRYVCYADYITEENKDDIYDEEYLFNNDQISDLFFREGPTFNYIITRSAHMSYRYNEVLSHYALKKYPQYRGLTGNEEEDCMYVKAKLVDDMFARLLAELEAEGQLENTVIVAFTDHYTYAVEDQTLVWERSGVDDPLLVEKTPAFIWSADCPDLDVEKTLNTSDILPTVLNLLGVDSPYDYIGQDAFDENYPGYALFPNGSWVTDGVAYSVATDRLIYLEEDREPVTQDFQGEMATKCMDFVYINNLILDSDYYAAR